MSSLCSLLLQSNAQSWQRYTQHTFVCQLADGSLPRVCFEHYLKQDYVFLKHFARAFGLAAFKSQTLKQLLHAKASMSAIVDIELDLHIRYCEKWGLSREELENTIESTANMAYTRYVMERGLAGDLLDLNVALAPCIIGYAHVAKWLLSQPFLQQENNPYQDWIAMYASDEYQSVAKAHEALLNDSDCRHMSSQRLAQLCENFGAATRLEIDFWQMGLDLR